jgi:hypothetical protein
MRVLYVRLCACMYMRVPVRVCVYVRLCVRIHVSTCHAAKFELAKD